MYMVIFLLTTSITFNCTQFSVSVSFFGCVELNPSFLLPDNQEEVVHTLGLAAGTLGLAAGTLGLDAGFV